MFTDEQSSEIATSALKKFKRLVFEFQKSWFVFYIYIYKQLVKLEILGYLTITELLSLLILKIFYLFKQAVPRIRILFTLEIATNL